MERFWYQIVTGTKIADNAKNGAVRRYSVRAIAPRFHHASSSSITGNMMTAGLANRARANVTTAIQYRRGRESRYSSSAIAASSSDSVFFSSAIHATDSAHTGWTAKMAAAIHAPRTCSRRSTRHSMTAAPPCRSTFTR